MAKSRTTLLLPLLFAHAPATAQILRAPADPLGDIAAQRLDGVLKERSLPMSDCAGTAEEEIVICGERRGPDYRVPYEPEPGARPVRAQGEIPRATDSIPDCIRVCNQPVMIHLDPIKLIRDPVGALRDMLRGSR